MSVVTVTTIDLDAAADLCEHAFLDYPLMSALFPGAARRRAPIVRRLYGSLVADCVRHGVVHGVGRAGRLVGVAAWLPPDRYPEGPLRQLRLTPVVLSVLRRFPRRARAGVEALRVFEEHHPTVPPHWYLEVLAVHPDHQRRGFGGALVEPVLELADSTGTPAFLETSSETNADWYGRLGFETRVRVPAFSGGPDQWFMWRDPAPSRRA